MLERSKYKDNGYNVDGQHRDVITMHGEGKANIYICYKWKYEYVKKNCKINFNKPLALTVNNLLKPLLSKPETILIRRKYETIHWLRYNFDFKKDELDSNFVQWELSLKSLAYFYKLAHCKWKKKPRFLKF